MWTSRQSCGCKGDEIASRNNFLDLARNQVNGVAGTWKLAAARPIFRSTFVVITDQSSSSTGIENNPEEMDHGAFFLCELRSFRASSKYQNVSILAICSFAAFVTS
jgi:hypothetical protein